MNKVSCAFVVLLSWCGAGAAALGAIAAELDWTYRVAIVGLTLAACWAVHVLTSAVSVELTCLRRDIEWDRRIRNIGRKGGL